jgi:hypothetical protein
MSKKDLVVSFSGGRTSAYMCKWLLDNMSHVFDFHFVFANTGQEHEGTLFFVYQCDQAFGLNLTWLEASVDPKKGKGTSYSIVDFFTASRSGEPFEAVISKYGIPNKEYPHCTRELKLEPMKKWAKDKGLSEADHALGIRADEPKRYKPRKGVLYPLVQLHPVDKGHIIQWWRTQSFDLQVKEHFGNCAWCWKKSERKLKTLALEAPEIFEFPMRMEKEYGHIITNPDIGDRRVFFRERRSTVDILELAKQPFDPFIDPDAEECAEECGSVYPEEISTIDNSGNT